MRARWRHQSLKLSLNLLALYARYGPFPTFCPAYSPQRIVYYGAADGAGLQGSDLRRLPGQGRAQSRRRFGRANFLRGPLEGPRRASCGSKSIALGESVWNAGSVAKARGVPFFEIGYHRANAGRRGGPFHKTLRASEHDGPDIKQAREEWTLTRQPTMRLEPHRLVFLDEIGTTTKMARLRGRSLRGQRLLSKVPFGHWKTQTFIAGLRCDALTAPFVIDAPMDRRIFETYVEFNWLRSSSRATSSSWTICQPIKAPPPSRPFARWALGSYSFRPIAPTSIRSRWLSQR